jgi:hypothetical protein
MNNTFIVSLVIILLLIISIIIYLYINNCNGNLTINNKKEGFTSIDSSINGISFLTGTYYRDYVYPSQPNVVTSTTGFFYKEGFTNDYQNLLTGFLAIIKVFDSELTEINYNYQVNHIFKVNFPTASNITSSNPSSIQILYESFAKDNNIPNVDNQTRGNLLSVIFNPSSGWNNSTCKIIDNTSDTPIVYDNFNSLLNVIKNNLNFTFQIKTSLTRLGALYYSHVIFSFNPTGSESVVVARIKIDNPSAINHFINKVRNIAVLSKEGIACNVSSNIEGYIYPSYISGTTKRTLINSNIMNNKISSVLPDFQNSYLAKIDAKSSLIDPEMGMTGVSLPITSSIGISINNNKQKSFYFNSEINGVNVYKSIPLPPDDQNEVKQYIYSKGYLIILNANNKIYYCKNCKIHTGEVEWKGLGLTPSTVNNIDKKKIAFDVVNNILFILSYNGIIYYCNGIDSASPTCSLLTPPSDDGSFMDFDVIPNKIVIIGGYTKFVFISDYSANNLRNLQWKVIDKSNDITSINLNIKGIMAKNSSGAAFFCQFPCLMKGTNTWVQMGDEIVDGISGNANLLSIIKNNNIYTCTQPCDKDKLKKLNQIGVHSGKIIDYLFPTVQLQTSPFNNLEQININSKSTKIDIYTNNINNLLTNIQNNINIFKTKQGEFQTYLNRQITQRDKYINHIKAGYTCLDKLINSPNKNQKDQVCEDYFNNQADYAQEVLNFETNEKVLNAASIVTPAPTSAPTPTVDPNSEFFSNQSGKWTEYFTNYSALSADKMLAKLGTVKIYKSDLLQQGEDIIAIME